MFLGFETLNIVHSSFKIPFPFQPNSKTMREFIILRYPCKNRSKLFNIKYKRIKSPSPNIDPIS